LALRSSRNRTNQRQPARRDSNRLLALGAKTVVGLVFFLALSAQAGVREVGPIGLTVDNLERELFFYTNTLSFELIGISEAKGAELDRLLGVQDVRLRSAELNWATSASLWPNISAQRAVRFLRIREATITGFSTSPSWFAIWTRPTSGFVGTR
jgi:hypothetical protein